jgi:hypothetical protein
MMRKLNGGYNSLENLEKDQNETRKPDRIYRPEYVGVIVEYMHRVASPKPIGYRSFRVHPMLLDKRLDLPQGPRRVIDDAIDCFDRLDQSIVLMHHRESCIYA